ncbi:NAD(P)/FAD-dependent oxidoreductase [Paraburkholderia caffeinilytica]
MEYFDILIIGAGMSGIGAAYHLQHLLPGKRYAILESRTELGGTWSLFRYPGIRSDSDMYTFGYGFRPWTGEKTIADGESILTYVRDTAKEYGIDRHIRFGQRVVSAAWSSPDACWIVEVETVGTGASVRYRCGFLYLCSGYYDYEKGYTPTFPGQDAFAGKIIHPQHWPQDFDHTGKRIVVIGSGATAVTLIPALSDRAAQVTMLQRSPTYIAPLPARNAFADRLRRMLPARSAHQLIRARIVAVSMFYYQLARRFPSLVKKMIRRSQQRFLPADYAFDTHFNPSYDPWDQRVCVVPDGDMFKAIASGRAAVVTDHIDAFERDGIRLKSGRTLPADVIVTATGLKLKAFGGIRMTIDDVPVEPGSTYTYQGVMLGNVPNLAFCVGYINASWTLRADLSSAFVCRVLAHMDKHGFKKVRPVADHDALQPPRPLLGFNSGYVLRSVDAFPKQSDRAPWRLRQNYLLDLLGLRLRPLNDGVLAFSRRGAEHGTDRQRSAT